MYAAIRLVFEGRTHRLHCAVDEAALIRASPPAGRDRPSVSRNLCKICASLEIFHIRWPYQRNIGKLLPGTFTPILGFLRFCFRIMSPYKTDGRTDGGRARPVMRTNDDGRMTVDLLPVAHRMLINPGSSRPTHRWSQVGRHRPRDHSSPSLHRTQSVLSWPTHEAHVEWHGRHCLSSGPPTAPPAGLSIICRCVSSPAGDDMLPPCSL